MNFFNRYSMSGLLLSALLSTSIHAQSASFETLTAIEQERNISNIYRAYYPSEAIARKAVITFHGQLHEANYQDGYLILELTSEEVDRLKAFDFTLQPATKFIERRNKRLELIQQRLLDQGSMVDNALLTIPNYPCYETVEETFAAAEGIEANNPNIAEFIDVGNSWRKTQGLGGYDMKVLVLTNKNTGGDKPVLFINSAIHAREYTTAPLSLAFANWLVDGYGVDADATWLLDYHEVHLMLQTNPDGRKRAETGLSWRKNTNQNFCSPTSNSRGVDLNRNFSERWNITNGVGSSGNSCSNTFRGPSAGSEPEIQALESYVRSIFADRRGPGDNDAAPADTSGIHLDIHSFSELVLWPWGDKNSLAPNGVQLRTLGRKFAFFNGYEPQQSIGLYPTDGTSDGVSYAELGVAAFTFELGTSFFQSCAVFNNTIKPDNLPALIYAAKVVRTPYITPAGPNVENLVLANSASTSGVPAGTSVGISALTSDLRFSTRNGTEATQNISAVEYYLDIPPWESGATAVSLSAADGGFNEKSEAVVGTINTAGLSVGRHLVYVRARDASDSWGAVSASFLVITDGTVPTPTPGPGCSVEESFENGAAQWTNSSASSCTTGDFIVGTPSAQINGGVTTQVGGASDGVNAFYTATNSSVGRNDVDGGNCIANSPSYSVATASTLTIDYFHGQRDTGDDSAGDFFRLELSTDGGNAFSTIASNGDVRSNASWTTATAAIPAGANVVVRVQCSDGSGPGDLVECGLDRLRVCPR